MRYETIEALLSALRRTMRGATTKQVAEMLGWPRNVAQDRLAKLAALKIITRRPIPRPTSKGRPQYRYSAGRRINA